MSEWWAGLTALNKVFYYAAVFFGALFLWQLIASLIGLGEHEADADADGGLDGHEVGADADVGVDHDATYAHFEHGAEADAVDSGVAFRLLGVRSVITFFTLFTWGGAMYLDRGVAVTPALTYATLWGLSGMFIIALLFHFLRKLSESGTANLSSCVGKRATVYLNIPAGGQGEIRTEVSGTVTYVKARVVGGGGVEAGTPVNVVRRLTETTVEVEPIAREEPEETKETPQ